MGENVLHHDAACRGLRPHRAQRNEATAGARKTVASNTLSNNFGHLVLVRITHYPADPRQRCSFLRGTLGVAASYQYLAVGVLAVNAPDGRTGVVICGGGYGTGIEDHYLGLGGNQGPVEPLGAQLLLNGGAIRLGGAAAEVLHIEARHSAIIGLVAADAATLETLTAPLASQDWFRPNPNSRENL